MNVVPAAAPPVLLKVTALVTEPAVVAEVADPAVVAEVAVAALPLMLMLQVPDAPEPVAEGTLRLDRAVAASVAPVPPLATASVPPSVSVPDVVIAPPVSVRPVVPPDPETEVTVPVLLVKPDGLLAG